MAIQVLELHHHGIRVGPSKDDVAKARKFYGDVLGLSHDPGRPEIPTIDGYWMDVGGTAQIHLMGVEGQSKFAKGPGKDPSLPHPGALLVCARRAFARSSRDADRQRLASGSDARERRHQHPLPPAACHPGHARDAGRPRRPLRTRSRRLHRRHEPHHRRPSVRQKVTVGVLSRLRGRGTTRSVVEGAAACAE